MGLLGARSTYFPDNLLEFISDRQVKSSDQTVTIPSGADIMDKGVYVAMPEAQ
jgi:hypothetical protein